MDHNASNTLNRTLQGILLALQSIDREAKGINSELSAMKDEIERIKSSLDYYIEGKH